MFIFSAVRSLSKSRTIVGGGEGGKEGGGSGGGDSGGCDGDGGDGEGDGSKGGTGNGKDIGKGGDGGENIRICRESSIFIFTIDLKLGYISLHEYDNT